MRNKSFIVHYVDKIYYSYHKISLNRVETYIESTQWLNHKKLTVNPHNNDKESWMQIKSIILLLENYML